MTSLQEILQQDNLINNNLINNTQQNNQLNNLINQPINQLNMPNTQYSPQQINNSQIESITQDLNNMKKETEILNNDIDNSEDLFNENKKSYKNILINFIIILVVYLIFSTNTIKQIFSNIIVGIYPNNNNISIIALLIYGSIISICCSLLNYKFN